MTTPPQHILMHLPASAAAKLVQDGLAEYHTETLRGTGQVLAEIAISTGGGVATAVVLALSRRTIDAVSNVLQKWAFKEPENTRDIILTRTDIHSTSTVQSTVTQDHLGVAVYEALSEAAESQPDDDPR